VQAGYGLSAISKPYDGFFCLPASWIVFARSLRSPGEEGIRYRRKGVQYYPTKPHLQPKEKFSDFNRAMDTVQAQFLGPASRCCFYTNHPENIIKALFYIAFIPGVFAVDGVHFLLRKKPEINRRKNIRLVFFHFLHYWTRESCQLHKKLVMGTFAFHIYSNRSECIPVAEQQNNQVCDDTNGE
jgi:hypothetical protein